MKETGEKGKKTDLELSTVHTLMATTLIVLIVMTVVLWWLGVPYFALFSMPFLLAGFVISLWMAI
jgi:hypothetical protein